MLSLRSSGGKTGTYFRSVGRNWATVFATVPDPSSDLSDVVRDKWWNQLVPIVVEWKHGAEVTIIGLRFILWYNDVIPSEAKHPVRMTIA